MSSTLEQEKQCPVCDLTPRVLYLVECFDSITWHRYLPDPCVFLSFGEASTLCTVIEKNHGNMVLTRVVAIKRGHYTVDEMNTITEKANERT